MAVQNAESSIDIVSVERAVKAILWERITFGLENTLNQLNYYARYLRKKTQNKQDQPNNNLQAQANSLRWSTAGVGLRWLFW